MAFTVVVDVPPIEATEAARALETCNAALGVEKCALAGPEAVGQWYAVVRFDAERKEVLSIALYAGAASGARVASSELDFEERDSPTERWASAGVVVAALVAAQPEAPAAASEKPRPPPAPVVTPPSARPAPVSPYWPRLELGGSVGSESGDSDGTRAGGLARLGIAFANVPVFGFASGAYAARVAGTPNISWLTGSLGFGVRVGFAQQRGALELRSEAVLESVAFRASDGARSESAHRTRFGPRLGLDLSGYLSKNWALVLGAEASALGPGVAIEVAGQPSGRLATFGWGFISAVRYDFR